ATATAEDRCGMPDRLERQLDERLLRARAKQQMPDDAEARRSLPSGLERFIRLLRRDQLPEAVRAPAPTRGPATPCRQPFGKRPPLLPRVSPRSRGSACGPHGAHHDLFAAREYYSGGRSTGLAQITIQLDLGRRSLTVRPPSRPPLRSRWEVRQFGAAA